MAYPGPSATVKLEVDLTTSTANAAIPRKSTVPGFNSDLLRPSSNPQPPPLIPQIPNTLPQAGATVGAGASSSASKVWEERPDLYDTDDDEDAENDPNCPTITLSASEKRELRRPWAHSLIIHLSDNVSGGYLQLKRRLEHKWSLNGSSFTLVDIGNAHYVAKLSSSYDYRRVMAQGPWIIGDNYLTVRRWSPNFDPDNDPNTMLTVWAHIPGLSLEYFQEVFLRRIGERIGRVIHIDSPSLSGDPGQSARFAVEIDSSKPLLLKFCFLGKIWPIQYDGIRILCYNCGKIGHADHNCPDSNPVPVLRLSSKKHKAEKQTEKAKPVTKEEGKRKTSERVKAEPSSEELYRVVATILKEVDFNTATFLDIVQQLGTRFGLDLRHRKAEMKEILLQVLGSMH